MLEMKSARLDLEFLFHCRPESVYRGLRHASRDVSTVLGVQVVKNGIPEVDALPIDHFSVLAAQLRGRAFTAVILRIPFEVSEKLGFCPVLGADRRAVFRRDDAPQSRAIIPV